MDATCARAPRAAGASSQRKVKAKAPSAKGKTAPVVREGLQAYGIGAPVSAQAEDPGVRGGGGGGGGGGLRRAGGRPLRGGADDALDNEDNVIMCLSFARSRQQHPDPYDITNGGSDSVFNSHPCFLDAVQQQQQQQQQMSLMPMTMHMPMPMPMPMHTHTHTHMHTHTHTQMSMHMPLSDGGLRGAGAGVGAGEGAGALMGAGGGPLPLPLPPLHSRSQPPLRAVVRLLTDFEQKSKGGEWPLSTSVCCYWCCHRFDNAPVGMPIKYSGGMFHVVGCYCSLDCACAQNFANRDGLDECLGRYSLINALSERLGMDRVVSPAPDRLALAIFGGHMSIEEFRSYNGGGGARDRHIVVSCPPMLSVTQQVEEISNNDLSSEYRYIPLDRSRVLRYQEKLRLNRTKPLSNFCNTLDHSMRLKYSSSASASDPVGFPPLCAKS
jgi:hypothetical protein